MIKRGEIWWAELSDPSGSGPGFRRPVFIVQSDVFNRSLISTVVVAAITSNLDLANAPGNVRVSRRDSNLPKASVVNVSQVLTLDQRFLTSRVSQLPNQLIEKIDSGLRLVLKL